MKHNKFFLRLISVVCLGFIMFLQGCEVVKESMELSADLSKQHQSGPSFSDENVVDDVLLNINMGVYALMKSVSLDEGSVPVEQDATLGYKPSANAMGKIYFMPGLEYIGKGTKTKVQETSAKTHLSYLEVPLYALYHFNSTSDYGFFAGLGPYFAYGIGGKIKVEGNDTQTDFDAFGDNGAFKRFDFGLSPTVGYQTKGAFYFRAAYDFGLTNIELHGGEDKTKNRCLSLNIGYSLNNLFHKGK